MMLLKGEVRGHALNSHGNNIDHGIVFLNFCENPVEIGLCPSSVR